MVIKVANQPVATWRGGTMRAIYADPPEMLDKLAAAQLWIGTATIERNGPYSIFANRIRIHLPMRGNGLHLHFQEPAETVALPTFAQAAFAGDRPLNVTLVDGPVEALNLIFAPTVTAQVALLSPTANRAPLILPALTGTTDVVRKAVRILYAVDGSCTIQAQQGATYLLQRGDAFVGDARGAQVVQQHDEHSTVLHAHCLLYVPSV